MKGAEIIMNEPKHYQHFELHMKNGEVVSVYEDYDIPYEEGLIGDFKRGKKKFLKILLLTLYSDSLHSYILKYHLHINDSQIYYSSRPLSPEPQIHIHCILNMSM